MTPATAIAPNTSDCSPQTALAQADRDRGGSEAQGHDAELEPREAGERGEDQEEHLRSSSRFGE
jgi:hypothetical protein